MVGVVAAVVVVDVVVVVVGAAVVLKKKLVKSLQAIAYSLRFPRFSQKIGNGNKTHLLELLLHSLLFDILFGTSGWSSGSPFPVLGGLEFRRCLCLRGC